MRFKILISENNSWRVLVNDDEWVDDVIALSCMQFPLEDAIYWRHLLGQCHERQSVGTDIIQCIVVNG